MPISKAVQCSTALPIVYKPVELKGRQMVDGGIRSTTNVDIAVEKGAKFIVVVNPLVPYVNDFENDDPDRLRQPRPPRLRHGPAGDRQPDLPPDRPRTACTRRSSTWQEKYPGVDIILIEPEPNDELMFGTPIMDYSRRLKIARHGFESVTATLAKDYERYEEIAATPRPRDLRAPRPPRRRASRPRRSRSQTSAWRRVLEQTTSVLLRQSGEAS